ncbi:MAG: chorismate synthase [Christensenellales bacterium]
MGSVYGRNIRVSLFGQSHSPAIGVVVDGLPAGFRPDLTALRAFLKRRAPGQTLLSTQRSEADLFEVLGGLSEGRLCGAPFAALIKNSDTRGGDYAAFRATPRPGHADYPAEVKYAGAQDSAGGGHFSGRLTAALCLAGGLCLQLLAEEGIQVAAHIQSIAGVQDACFDPLAPDFLQLQPGYLRVLDKEAALLMAEAINAARLEGDSVGGVIECAAIGLPAGLGEPMFDGLENRIAGAVFGIPAVKGIEFGEGFHAAALRGSQHNDPYTLKEGRIVTRTNRHGGILGGLSTGMPLLFRVAVKPTASIFQKQQTVDLASMQEAELLIKGRHDPCIVPRAVPCVEAACALALYDSVLDRRKEQYHGVE